MGTTDWKDDELAKQQKRIMELEEQNDKLKNKMAFNQIAPDEAERLDILAEEYSETIQAICKTKHHDYESRHPDGGPSNREQIELEVGYILFAIDMMKKRGDIADKCIEQSFNKKRLSIDKWLHHNSTVSDDSMRISRDDLEFRVKPEPRKRQRLSNVKKRRHVVVFIGLMVMLWGIPITTALFCS